MVSYVLNFFPNYHKEYIDGGSYLPPDLLKLCISYIVEEHKKHEPEYYITWTTVNGKRAGVERVWTNSGELISYTEWRNGQIHGKYKLWSHKGILLEHVTYVNNECNGPMTLYYDDGKLKFSHYVEDKYSICRSWHSNGLQSEEETWSGYKLNGLYLSWDDDGFLLQKGRYVDDKKCGDWYTYSHRVEGFYFIERFRDGLLYEKVTYDNGRKITEELYENRTMIKKCLL